MKNIEIYNLATSLSGAFQETTQYLPVKLNFYLQKNKTNLISLAQDIEKARMDIIKNYGVLSEDGQQYKIPEDKMETVTKELDDLFNLEQDITIYKVKINTLPDDISLTTGQMEALMFMIDED